jgi:hypothetical protein
VQIFGLQRSQYFHSERGAAQQEQVAGLLISKSFNSFAMLPPFPLALLGLLRLCRRFISQDDIGDLV